MTDAELRDAAEAHLKKTTVGYVNKHWTTPPPGSEWQQALDLLAQIGAAPPVPPPSSDLPFAEADLRTGYQTIKPSATTTDVHVPAGVDALIDLQNLERGAATLIWGAGDSRIRVLNAFHNITTPPGPVGDSGYRRGGLRIRSDDGIGPAHVSITNVLTMGQNVLDNFAFAAGTNTKITLQRARLENNYQVGKPSMEIDSGLHPDNIQEQGKVKALELGLCTLMPKDSAIYAGKCLQLSKESGQAPYSVSIKKVNCHLQGDNTGSAILVWYRDCPVTLEDFWVYKEGAGHCLWDQNDGCLLFPNGGSAGGDGVVAHWSTSGTKPNRTATFSANANIAGSVHEGLPGGADYVTRAMLGH